MARRSLKPQLNQIRAWVQQGRTDAWIAHQLEISAQELREFRKQYDLSPEDGSASAGETDLRDEIEAEIEAAAAEEKAEPTEEPAEEDEEESEGGPAPARSTRHCNCWAISVSCAPGRTMIGGSTNSPMRAAPRWTSTRRPSSISGPASPRPPIRA